MTRFLNILLLFFFSSGIFAQPGQLSISRIDQMPDLPMPFLIRDWTHVTRNYDNYVFDLAKTGQYLPLSRLGTKGQFNYPENIPFFMDSYVGVDNHLNHAEGINILPAVIGASLVGIDKSNQDGLNWVAMTKDFFNLKNGENIYLNSYSANSGNDWWYDVMPNVYFYQLRSIYPDAAPEFSSQFITVANRWLYCVNQLGGTTTPWIVPFMNYRAFNFSTGLPLNTSVPEPESAGSIAWILYNAYLETGNRKYFEGAKLVMEYLSGLNTNPSYELQLPYGTIAAARMNAVEGSNYPIQKMLDWCFNRGELREWGSITGNWGGFDVSGLIGEANDAGNDYAFVMNGFQQAAALAPLPKYDKHYSLAIAKWILNVANASRLFYWNALPQSNQDSHVWASANDPDACIPYESMKETWLGKSPFSTGDAVRGGWASTNLSLYSGSSVGYLAAVVKTTNIPEILQIDLNKTDFYGENNLVSYLYFNPTPDIKLLNISLPAGSFGVYEAITETVLFSSASSSIKVSIPSGEVRLIRLYASGITPVSNNGRLYAGNDILDYHYQYNYSENLTIKALSVKYNTIITNSQFTAWCEPGNIDPADPVQFQWFMNDVLLPGQTQSTGVFTSPALPAQLVLRCKITANTQSAEDTLQLSVVDRIPQAPEITGIQSGSKYTIIGDIGTFTAIVKPVPGDILEYFWTASSGTLNQTSGSSVTWLAPEIRGVASITLKVSNQDLLSTTVSIPVLVKDTSLVFQDPVIYYPFDTDNKNASANRFHAIAAGAVKSTDARGIPSLAYRFTSGSNIIYTDNDPDLNFTDAVSLSCWVKCEELGSERFIISHGSWQQRYKLSITPEGFIRWTVKTSTGITDLDASTPVELNRYYHVTVLYTGFSMELYINGVFDAFKAFSGAILPSTKPITIGRMDNIETQYALRGSVDEVKIWDKEIPVPQVAILKNQWTTAVGIPGFTGNLLVYPNPAYKNIYIETGEENQINKISLLSAAGKEIRITSTGRENNTTIINIPETPPGLYLLKLEMKNGQTVNRKLIILE